MEDVIKRPVGSSNILLVILIQFTNNEFVFVFIRVEKALFEALWGNISITAYTRWLCRLDSLSFLRKVTFMDSSRMYVNLPYSYALWERG